MSLVVHNSLTRTKEEFVPREAGKVSMYVCGPTVYNHIHVGNARAFLVFDVMRRYLRWSGFDVKFVQNYTDIDDRIIARAAEEGRDAADVAHQYSRAFEEAMAALEVEPPDILVKATEYIPQMIKLIEGLLEKGHAYEAGGSVWFSVESFVGYGKLSGRNLEDMRAGERVEPDESKHHPLDFALWKAVKPGEPSWESPWGPGRPGWHIECSAMSLEHLGMGIDIHGGGTDLMFPHHENEIAQSEAYSEEAPFVRYWLHNGLVRVDEEKMSKSLGNFVLLKDVVSRIPPQVIRLLNLSSHYRSDVDFGSDRVAQAKAIYERFEIFTTTSQEAYERGSRDPNEAPQRSGEAGEFVDRFRDAMDDDFNTPGALSVIHDLVRTGNSAREDPERFPALASVFRELVSVLGVLPPATAAQDEEVMGLIEAREKARTDGAYDVADRIRDELTARGIILEDSPSGTRWRRTAIDRDT